MPINKRDRSFQNIVREVDIEQVPVEYIDTLTLVLKNGDRVEFAGSDLEEVEADNIVSFVMTVAEEIGDEYGSDINNVEIVINYSELEADIKEKVSKLLNKKDDKSDPSV